MSRLSPWCRWPLYRDGKKDGTVLVSKWIHIGARKMGKEAVPVLLSLLSHICKLLETFCLQNISCCLCGRVGPDSSLSWSSIKKKKKSQPNQASGFPGGSGVKNPPANAADASSIPGWGRSSGEGNGNPLQHSCLENPMDWDAWTATVHGVPQSQTRLSH